MRRLFFLALSCAALTWAAGEEIKEAEKRWADAVRTRDVKALESIYTPGLIYAHATGKVEDKQTYLERLKAGKQKYDSITQESIRVEMYGDSAVAHAIMRMKGTNDAGPFNDHVMMMHTWVKQNGAWRLAGHQTTKIP